MSLHRYYNQPIRDNEDRRHFESLRMSDLPLDTFQEHDGMKFHLRRPTRNQIVFWATMVLGMIAALI